MDTKTDFDTVLAKTTIDALSRTVWPVNAIDTVASCLAPEKLRAQITRQLLYS